VRARVLLGLLAAAAAGCVTETRTVGRDPVDAARRADWAASGAEVPPDPLGPEGPHDAFFNPPPRNPEDVVEVPVEAYAPLDKFFDQEGYLIGDRIEIDCSFQPFMGRMVGLGFERTGTPYVVREERREGNVHVVRLVNLERGAAYQANLVPKATFASQSRPPEVKDETGKPVGLKVRPVFEFVASEEIVVRMHLEGDPARPVWFQARAIGTPAPLSPDTPRDCIYVNANRRRREKATDLALGLEIRRRSDGKWETLIEDPGR